MIPMYFQFIPPSYSHLQASIYTKNAGGILFFFFCVFKVLLLHISKTYSDSDCSECHLSNETNTMHIIQMAQEQHAIYFGYAFFRRFRQIYDGVLVPHKKKKKSKTTRLKS